MLKQSFLDAMSLTAAAVTVVTTDGAGGRAGATVTAMTSVSADGEHPLLLLCIHHRSRTAAAIIANGACSVNILSEDQGEVSDIFAGRAGDRGDRFLRGDWETGATGCPRLRGTLAAFDCTVAGQMRQGSHEVFFCEVRNVSFGDRACPLLYFDRGYGTFGRCQA